MTCYLVKVNLHMIKKCSQYTTVQIRHNGLQKTNNSLQYANENEKGSRLLCKDIGQKEV